jgi:hypothetical protein
MYEWCRKHATTGTWEHHAFTDTKRLDDRGIPMEFARFYFLNETDANAFRRDWIEGGGTTD